MSTAPIRRQFTELHPKDQTTKLNRKARIETNWGVLIQDCLPINIRPRVELKKGAKARVGDIGVAEEVWWNWSVELLRGLEELSTSTASKLGFAQELLTLEVSQRQQNPKHPQRKLAELLLGDVQRVCEGMRRNHREAIMGEAEDQDEGDEDDAMDCQEVQVLRKGSVEGREGSSASPCPSIDTPNTRQAPAATMTANNVPMSPGDNVASPPVYTPTHRAHHGPSHGNSHQALSWQIRATEMRARAVRLRANATRLEAEATDLEVDAGELRAQLEGPEVADSA
ncbi:hypothetical protein MBLNU459_g7135t1 [Dothideomycetes sp. NU459]